MTNKEAIETNKNLIEYMRILDKTSKCKFYKPLEENYEALDMAIQALEQIQQIKDIINATVYIQEDVLRYKMICEVINGKERI